MLPAPHPDDQYKSHLTESVFHRFPSTFLPFLLHVSEDVFRTILHQVPDLLPSTKYFLSQHCNLESNILKNVKVKSKPDAQNDPDVQAAVAAVAEALGETGRILVRESGTEPVIRVMVEAATQEECQKYVDDVVDVICARGHARV